MNADAEAEAKEDVGDTSDETSRPRVASGDSDSRRRAAVSGAITVKYAVELTQATLEMHLFGPFMGFLYELIDTLNRAQEENQNIDDERRADDVSAAVAEDIYRKLEETSKSISATATSINGIYRVRPNKGLIGNLLGAQKNDKTAGSDAATKKSFKLFSKLLQYHQHRLRALMVLESTLRNCVESFLNNIIEIDFTSVLVDIINDDNMIKVDEDDSARVSNVEKFIRTTHVEESQVSIRVLEWIEYNKSQQGRRVRQWFGKHMDGEWSTHFSRHRRRSLLRLWELSLGSKYEWMAEREDAAETIQRIWRGHRERIELDGGLDEGDGGNEGDGDEDGFDADAAFDDSSYYLQRSLTGYGQMIVDAEESEVNEELEASGSEFKFKATSSEAPKKKAGSKARSGLWKKAQGKVHNIANAKTDTSAPVDTAARKMTKMKLSQRDHKYTAPTRKYADEIVEGSEGEDDPIEQDEDAIAVARDRILKAAFDARQAYRKEKKLNAVADDEAFVDA